MDERDDAWAEVEKLIETIVQGQKETLLRCGRRLISTLTPEDILQPNDFPELEQHPCFRYEEGVLAGMQTIQMALWALKKSVKVESSYPT